MTYVPNVYPATGSTPEPPPELILVTSSLPTAYVGVPYTATLQATGGTGPFAWDFAVGTLPAWATLTPSTTNTTTITGTPTSGDLGSTALTPRITDSLAAADTNGSLTLTVEEVPVALTVTTSSLPAVTRGQAYSATVEASGGMPPYSWELLAPNNVLPGGITRTGNVLDATQVTEAGTFPLQFRATDAALTPADSGILNLVVNQVADLTIDTPASLSGEVGTDYSRTLATSGGWGTVTWTKTAGAYPPGVNLVSGVLTGTPTTAEIYVFTLEAEDTEGRTASRTFTFTVVAEGTLELPYDYFDEWSVHEDIHLAQDFRLSAAGLQALQKTPSATGGPWSYDFAGDTHPEKQDAMKLYHDVVKLDGTYSWTISTSYQLYMALPTAITYPDKVLYTWDWYWCNEYLANNNAPPNAGVYAFKAWQTRNGVGSGWWTHLQYLTLDDQLRYFDAVRSGVGAAEYIPNGMTSAGDDRIVPLGAGVGYSQQNYANSYAPAISTWTRYWIEIRFARPHTEFTSWNAAYGVTVQPNLDDMSGLGRWHMISMWVADETRDVERILYQAPMGWQSRRQINRVVDSATLSTLTDADGGFGNASQIAGKYVQVEFGDGSREYRLIQSHTNTVITTATPFTQVPQAGDVYWTENWLPTMSHFTYEMNTSKVGAIGPMVGYGRPFMAFKNYPLSDVNPEADPIFRKPVR